MFPQHSTNYRAYPRPTKAPFNGPYPAFGSNVLGPSHPPILIPQKYPEPNPPTQLAIASLSPPSQPTSRAPSPWDKGPKQAPESKKSKKLTKGQRETEGEVVSSRKTSASGESVIPTTNGSNAPPTLPFLPFPSVAGEDGSVSDLSVSGWSTSSSATATQLQLGRAAQLDVSPLGRLSNEPRSVFEDDTDDARSSQVATPAPGHTHNPSVSTSNSNDTHKDKDKEGKLLRTMRSFKLSFKGQKAPKQAAPPIPTVPSLPPTLTLELGKGAPLSEGLADPANTSKEERVLKIAEMFASEVGRTTRSGSAGNISSVYTTQSHSSEQRSDGQSDVGHAAKSPSQSEVGHAAYSDLGHTPIRIAGASWSVHAKPIVARRRSVNELDAGEAVKDRDTGVLGTRGKHARTRSKSGDFTGLGWEKGTRVPVPTGNTVEPPATQPTPAPPAAQPMPARPSTAPTIPPPKPPPTRRPPKPTKFFVTNPSRISTATTISDGEARSPTSPPRMPSFKKTQVSADRGNEDVQHQLQSFVASMRDDRASGYTTFGRSSDEGYTRDPLARIRSNDSDAVRSSEEYDPDPFRAQARGARMPRPESEALPHQIVIPSRELPKEMPLVRPLVTTPPKRSYAPTAFRSPERELPSGLVRTSSVSARPSVVIGTDLAEAQSAAVISPVESENIASEEGWAPLEPKRAASQDGQIPDGGHFLDVRVDRQRASGLSIPRSVTPDSPRAVCSGLGTSPREPSPHLTTPFVARALTPSALSVVPLAVRSSSGSMSSTPHESTRFLDPEAIPASQKRGRVSPFPVKPLRDRSDSTDRAANASMREKYPGGVDRYEGLGLQVPRVRFIGVRSSNGSSQAGWQARLDEMDSPSEAQFGERPASWLEFEEPEYSGYEGDAPAFERPGWALDDSAASRSSTFTLASVYDDEEEPDVPKTERLAAAVRGMGRI